MDFGLKFQKISKINSSIIITGDTGATIMTSWSIFRIWSDHLPKRSSPPILIIFTNFTHWNFSQKNTVFSRFWRNNWKCPENIFWTKIRHFRKENGHFRIKAGYFCQKNVPKNELKWSVFFRKTVFTANLKKVWLGNVIRNEIILFLFSKAAMFYPNWLILMKISQKLT